MKNPFDKVIVSSDDSPMFLNFWPTASKAYQKYFDIKPTLALVTNLPQDHEIIEKAKLYGEVITVKKISGVPVPNLAKIARFLVASQQENYVCMIEDIDTIPLQSSFIMDRVSKRSSGEILAVGHEVLAGTPHEGKFPISNITAEGYNFKALFNPHNLELGACVESLFGMSVFDHKENVLNDPSIFSDESLIRALIEKNSLSHLIKKVDRNVDIHCDWIDRSWWHVDEKKLKSNGYICCNFLRPFKDNIHHFLPIIKHIYGEQKLVYDLCII